MVARRSIENVSIEVGGRNICAMVKVVAIFGKPPTFNDGILIMGIYNPYGLGLMSLSPIIWK